MVRHRARTGRSATRRWISSSARNAATIPTPAPPIRIRGCSRAFEKKAEALPSFMGHVLMDNRSKLAIDARFRALATGTAERTAALEELLARLAGEQRKTVGADGPSTARTLSAPAASSTSPRMWRRTPMSTTPRPVNAPSGRRRIDARTTRHEGYQVSQVIRKLIETLFGDGKQHGATIRQVKLRGLPRNISDVLHPVHADAYGGPNSSRSRRHGGRRIDGKGPAALAVRVQIAAQNATAEPQTARNLAEASSLISKMSS